MTLSIYTSLRWHSEPVQGLSVMTLCEKIVARRISTRRVMSLHRRPQVTGSDDVRGFWLGQSGTPARRRGMRDRRDESCRKQMRHERWPLTTPGKMLALPNSSTLWRHN